MSSQWHHLAPLCFSKEVFNVQNVYVDRAALEITISHQTMCDQILKMSSPFHMMIGHNDQNISPARLELSSSRSTQQKANHDFEEDHDIF